VKNGFWYVKKKHDVIPDAILSSFFFSESKQKKEEE